MVHRLGIVGVAFAAMMVLGESAVHAESFRCSRAGSGGPSLQWSEREVSYGIAFGTAEAVGLSVTEFIELAERSFGAWQGAACSDIRFSFEGVDPEFEPGFRAGGLNANGIGHAESWPHDPEAIALTTTSFDTRSGRLLDADIELNGDDHRFVIADVACDAETGEMDLENVLTHEVGHFVGLDHPPSTPSNATTTMFGTSSPCETSKRSLSQGDLLGLCTIYPVGEPTRSCHAPDSIGFRVLSRDDGLEGGCRGARVPRSEPSFTGLVGFWALLAFLRWPRVARSVR